MQWSFVNNAFEIASPAELVSQGEALGDLVNISLEIEGNTLGGQVSVRVYTKLQDTLKDFLDFHGTLRFCLVFVTIPVIHTV